MARDTLTQRARMAVLPASASQSVPGTMTEILVATPCDEVRRNGAEWRVVDLYSDEGRPWEALIEWSGGMGGRRYARVTIAKATRLCVHASMVKVSGASLSLTTVTAWAAVSDGVVNAENEYSVRGDTSSVSHTVDVEVPPFARYVRMELSLAGRGTGSRRNTQ